MALKKWMLDKALYYLQDGTIDLNGTLKAALITSAAVDEYYQWASSSGYSSGYIITPTALKYNGRRYIALTGGTSGGTEPTWPTAQNAAVTDGGVTWQEFGGALCSHEIWADLSPYEVSEGNGYTTGGVELTGLSLVSANALLSGVWRRTVKWQANPVSWSVLTKTFRYMVVYAPGTKNGVVDPLIFYVLIDDTPADTVALGVDFNISWDAAGLHILYL